MFTAHHHTPLPGEGRFMSQSYIEERGVPSCNICFVGVTLPCNLSGAFVHSAFLNSLAVVGCSRSHYGRCSAPKLS